MTLFVPCGTSQNRLIIKQKFCIAGNAVSNTAYYSSYISCRIFAFGTDPRIPAMFPLCVAMLIDWKR